MNPRISAIINIIGLKYIEYTPKTRKIVFSEKGKLTVQARKFNPKPVGNNMIANKQIFVKFNLPNINFLFA